MNTDALIRELASRAAPVEPLPHPLRRHFYWLAFALCFVFAATVGLGVRSDISSAISEPGFVLQAVSLLLLALAAGNSAFYSGVPGHGTASIWWLPGLALAGWLLVVLGPAFQDAPGHAGAGLRCLRNMLLLSLPPAAALYLMLSRALPLAGAATGVLIFLAAFALGSLGTRFICPHDSVRHFFVWHGVPVIALATAGALLGRFFLRMSRLHA